MINHNAVAFFIATATGGSKKGATCYSLDIKNRMQLRVLKSKKRFYKAVKFN